MKILIINTFDSIGGADKAAYRLFSGLKKIGVKTQMLVKNKKRDEHLIIEPQKVIDKFIFYISGTMDLGPSRLIYKKNMSIQWMPNRLSKMIDNLNPNIVNLHWINSGFLQIECIKNIKCPVVWTLHDMWPFTGGCHYSYNCYGYKKECGKCPQLNSRKKLDLSYFTHKRKQRSWRNKEITVITPSRWLSKKASESFLFNKNRIEIIPNGLDLDVFKPIEKKIARKILNLPNNEILILLVARNLSDNDRKGGKYIKTLIREINKIKLNEKIKFVIVGTKIKENISGYWNNFYLLGKFEDSYSMVLVYSSVDLYVHLSEAENLPNTIMESFACETPVIAFSIGGISEMIDHKNNGYLARPFDISEIKRGISYILSDEKRYLRIKKRAREKAKKEYNHLLQARRYSELYSSITNKYK